MALIFLGVLSFLPLQVSIFNKLGLPCLYC